jgi:octopine/nopaline transport system permease protein
MDWPFLRDTFLLLLEKVPLTLNLAFMSLGMGAILGAILAFMRLSGSKIAAAIASAYLFVLRGTPLLVQIFLIYYGLGQFRHVLEAAHLWDSSASRIGARFLR